MARLVETVEGVKIVDEQDRTLLLIGLDGTLTTGGGLVAGGAAAITGVLTSANLQFPNSAATASAVGTVVKKNIVKNAAGTTLGYIPIYTSIT